MRYIKIFENTILRAERGLKVGDFVRLFNGKYIWQIISKDQETSPPLFYLEDTLELNGYKQPDQFWIRPMDLELVPEYEVDAMKYNL